MEDHTWKVFVLKPISETNSGPQPPPPLWILALCIKQSENRTSTFLLHLPFIFFVPDNVASLLYSCFFLVDLREVTSSQVRRLALRACVCVYKKQAHEVFPLSSCIMHRHHLPSSDRKTSKTSKFSLILKPNTRGDVLFPLGSRAISTCYIKRKRRQQQPV